jgi:hypothetical protein
MINYTQTTSHASTKATIGELVHINFWRAAILATTPSHSLGRGSDAGPPPQLGSTILLPTDNWFIVHSMSYLCVIDFNTQ